MTAKEDVLLWDIYNDLPYKTLDGLDCQIQKGRGLLEFSPDGRFLAMSKDIVDWGTPKTLLKVWRVSNWTEITSPSFQGREMDGLTERSRRTAHTSLPSIVVES